MPRPKEYKESEVVEKAMNLFWRRGYESTSMKMLEEEMGINKFSIYSSFKNKNGLLIESLKCYKQKLNVLLDKLKVSDKGEAAIREYFYDFVEFSKEIEFGKGCLIANTANETAADIDESVKYVLSEYTNEVRQIFKSCLAQDSMKSKRQIEQEADYLIISVFGLSSATKVFSEDQIDNYIQNIFKSL